MLSAPERVPEQIHALTEEEVRERRERFGVNVLVPERSRSPFVWFVRLLLDPMVLLLLAASCAYLVLGDRFDAIVALVAVVPIFLVSAILQSRSERALADLNRFAQATARVRRSLRDVAVDARDVVPDDILLVEAGDVVVADGLLISGTDLIVDESPLTGASQPIVKKPGEATLFAGTVVRSGYGEVAVTATGSSTKYGRIGKFMSESHVAPTPIEQRIYRIVMRLGAAVLLGCVAVVFLERSHGALWGAALIAGVSLAMAAVPEELPIVYALYLSRGAWKLTRGHALVRRLKSVEALASANVACVNKSGTLTQGTLALAASWAPSGDGTALVKIALLASEPASFDPIERALHEYAQQRLLVSEMPADAKPARVYAFDPAHRRITKAWKTVDGFRIVAKGAPEALFALCRSTPQDREAAQRVVEDYAKAGMRVLAVCERFRETLGTTRWEDEREMQLAGLLAFRDPVRDDAPQAVAACTRAGIDVIMITGDHAQTASAVARQLGLHTEGVLTGEQLDGLHDSELIAAVGSIRVFARIAPEQRLRIVRALHARGKVVAMTGDGANDGTVLNEADVGMATQKRGANIALARADLVLLQEDFPTIVAAFAAARSVFCKLRRAFGYLSAFHAPMIVSSLAAPLFGWPLMLLPVHLIGLELIVHPTSALVYENDPNDLNDLNARPPGIRGSAILAWREVVPSTLLGITLAAATLGAYVVGLRSGAPEETSRGIALATMLFGQILLVVAVRSTSVPVWKQSLTDNAWLLPVLFATAAIALAALYVPPAAFALHVRAPAATELAAAFLLAVLATLWLEPFKRSQGHR